MDESLKTSLNIKPNSVFPWSLEFIRYECENVFLLSYKYEATILRSTIQSMPITIRIDYLQPKITGNY